MAATAQTINYNGLFTSTLMNYNATLVDNVSKSMLLLYHLMKERDDGYVPAGDGLGAKKQINLMYGLNNAEPYADYDQIEYAPVDGITAAFWDWRQLATTVQISRIEERKNSGRHAIFKLLKARIKQATLGIQEKFAKMLMQGNGINNNAAGQIEAPYAHPTTGRKFIDPLFLLVKKDPTTSTTIGEINQSTETWWRNISYESTSSSYAGFLFELDDLYTQLQEGPGGSPTLFVCDRRTYLYYNAALRSKQRFIEYKRAGFPFEATDFHGHPLVWDTFMPNVEARTTTQSPSQGSLAMLSPQFLEIEYDPETNFMNTPFETPPDQDARSSKLLWYGAQGTSQRRKQGVMWGIDTTPVA